VNKGCALLRTSVHPTAASPTPASHLQHYIARLFNSEHTHPREEPPPGLDFHSLRQKRSGASQQSMRRGCMHVFQTSQHGAASVTLAPSGREHSCHSAALGTKQYSDRDTAKDLCTVSHILEVLKL